MMKKIALIYMGGTFGCVGEPLAPMPATLFLPKLTTLLNIKHNIECFESPVIKDSSACTAVDWLKLAAFIQSLQQQNFQHFIIIHGTDTLSYASATLAQILGHSAHLIFTGSQFPLLNTSGEHLHEHSDAIENLQFALSKIEDLPQGVYLAFHQRLIYAQTAIKQHTTALDAFTGTEISTNLQTQQQSINITPNLITRAASFNCLSLMIQPIEIEQQIHNFKNIRQNPPNALILQGFGTGNIAVNTNLLKILTEIRHRNCAVIITSQVLFGQIDQRYAISEWIQHANFLLSYSYSHADLYAKCLKMHLKYTDVNQWHEHWYD